MGSEKLIDEPPPMFGVGVGGITGLVQVKVKLAEAEFPALSSAVKLIT